jgi:hypothetical protein
MVESAKIISPIQIVLNGLVATKYNLSKYYGDLATKTNQINMTPKDREELRQHMVRMSQTIAGLGNLINTFKRRVKDAVVPGAVIGSTVRELVKMANTLDGAGDHLIADYIDETASAMVDKPVGSDLSKLASFFDDNGFYKLADKVDRTILKTADYGFIPRTRKATKEEPAPEPVQQPREGSLSTRYCPDHIGVQAFRVSDRTYQCPIDGRVYNYESGYKNYQGQRVPGGSIAAQTPTTSNYGGIPMRIYDSRQSILNTMH